MRGSERCGTMSCTLLNEMCIVQYWQKAVSRTSISCVLERISNMVVEITEEMRIAAQREAEKRNPHIKHHFELAYMSGNQRDIIGFLGEFACKQCLGLDWRKGIRDSYDTIDEGDILIPNHTIDIKTETIPRDILMRLVEGQVRDDRPYGRRLINQGQIGLLAHYDYVVWGAFSRESDKLWYSLGYLESDYIRKHYQVTIDTPFGSRYREPCINIRQSELKPVRELRNIIEIQR